MLDVISFTLIAIFALILIVMTLPMQPDIFTLIVFLLLLVPTIIALIQGAPFVPTPMNAAKKMLKLAGIKKNQQVIDIGCGDGRLVYIAANHYGARAVGFELSPIVWCIAKIRKLFWKSRAKIKFGDFRMHDLSKTDYIVCYMLPETLKNFIPKFEKELKKGAKVISYAFNIAGWAPVHIEPSDKTQKISDIMVYEIGKQYDK